MATAAEPRRNRRARVLAVGALAAGTVAVLAITGGLDGLFGEEERPPPNPTVERRELLDRDAERVP